MPTCTICEEEFTESQTRVICGSCEEAVTKLIGPKGRRKKFTLAQWTIAGAVHSAGELKKNIPADYRTNGVGRLCAWIYAHDKRR